MTEDASTARSTADLAELEASLLTGGQDPHYALGLATALTGQNVRLEVIGSDEVDLPEFRGNPKIEFLNLRGEQGRGAGLRQKIARVLRYYARLFQYAASAKPRLFHILWNNRLENFDRTVLLLYYKLLGKKIVFTAHNVNVARRDGGDGWLNRLTLKIQYRLVDHIFVHTRKMKDELQSGFGVAGSAVTVIPFGINTAIPDTGLTVTAARLKLGLQPNDKVILFFGAIAPYKGLDLLLQSFQQIAPRDATYRLLVAGKAKGGCEKYLDEIKDNVARNLTSGRAILRTEFIPDHDIEAYFKAADVMAMPYREIFQSGVLFLAQSFGLPVIATDVGSFREDIIEGESGFLCRPGDAADLARAMAQYFASELFRSLPAQRIQIKRHATERHSWNVVAEQTRNVYARLLRAAR